MATKTITDTPLQSLSDLIASRLGLHFPPERWTDLRRGLTGIMEEFGLTSMAECGEWILSSCLTRLDWQRIARHLTVGETYFFREKKMFDVLAHYVLSPLLASRRLQKNQHLRIWSAGCCTGEEPYSIAILLSQILPDPNEWRVTIMATDINDSFLRKAAAGIYSEWSFRDAPPWLKAGYFTRRMDGRYAILPEIRDCVTFANLNLVDDTFPTELNAMDVILCRNVLMYFNSRQARNVVGNIRRALAESGWLIVSASEYSQSLFSEFASTSISGVTLYQKGIVRADTSEPAFDWRLPPATDPVTIQPFGDGSAIKIDEPLRESPKFNEPLPQPREFSTEARALANAGRLAEALECCDRWIASEKFNPDAHYLRAVTLHEMGQINLARQAFQQAIYLRPDFVLAHFALGNLMRKSGRVKDAQRHFANSLRLLGSHDQEEVLSEFDDLAVGRIAEMIAASATSTPSE